MSHFDSRSRPSNHRMGLYLQLGELQVAGTAAGQGGAAPNLTQIVCERRKLREARKIQASITARDLVELTTIVFILKFCAPFIDLIASMFGATSSSQDRRPNDE